MTIKEEKEIMKAVTEKIHEVGRLLYSYEIHEILMLFIQEGGKE